MDVGNEGKSSMPPPGYDEYHQHQQPPQPQMPSIYPPAPEFNADQFQQQSEPVPNATAPTAQQQQPPTVEQEAALTPFPQQVRHEPWH